MHVFQVFGKLALPRQTLYEIDYIIVHSDDRPQRVEEIERERDEPMPFAMCVGSVHQTAHLTHRVRQNDASRADALLALNLYTLFVLHLRKLGGNFVDLVHEYQFRFRVAVLRVQLQSKSQGLAFYLSIAGKKTPGNCPRSPIRVQFRVACLPHRGKRAAQLFDVTVQYAVRVLFVRIEALLLLVLALQFRLVGLYVDRLEYGFGDLLLPPVAKLVRK